MGSSVWSNDFYRDREEVRAKTGKSAFDYNDRVLKAVPRHERKVHEKLNPNGVKIRESRDSKEHPESLAVSVVFDVTGSMASVPIACQKQLPRLMDLLTKTNFVKDPQVMFSAVGDAVSDRGSLQVGQFESGIEMDDDLGRMWLEGGGGGTMEESYQNAIYFFARHTSIDCFEKRGKKGYLFLVGDEKPYKKVSKEEVRDICGDSLQEDIPIENIIKEAQEKYHVFFVIPKNTSNGKDPVIRQTWTKLLGENNVLMLEYEDAISELVSLTVALTEGSTDLETAKASFKTLGCPAKNVNAAATSLRPMATALERVGTPTEATIRL